MAKLIPPVINPDTKSPGERELFMRLKQDPGCDSWTVLHSLNLAKHVKQVQGEVDFVIIIPELGILCLEVKAHHEVRVEEGMWLFGRQRKRDKSPFQQASDGMHSIRQRISSHPDLSGIVCWSAVLFTHTAFSQTSPEWHSWQAIGTRQYKSRPISDLLADVLKNAHSFLREHPTSCRWYKTNTKRPTQDECILIRQLLRPNFEVLETPRERAKRLEGEVIRYTEEQYAALDAMTRNHRVIFTGPAGTGKTVLALEAVKRAVAQNQRVLFLCFNQLLGRHLKEQCKALEPLVTTSTLHAHMRKIADTPVPENASTRFWQHELPMMATDRLLDNNETNIYDAIIIDEAQDILRGAYLDLLDLSLYRGLAEGQWRFFGDFEQQAIYKTDADDEMSLETFQQKRSGNATLFNLRINCRNTTQISTLVERVSQLEPGYSRVLRQGSDFEPRLHSFSTEHEQLQLLTNELTQLYEEGYRGDDIVVLSVLRDVDAAAAQLTTSPWQQRLVPFVARPAGHIGYSSIHAYKGLEAPVVILTDVEDVQDKDAASVLYVGLTRALHRLIVLLNKNANKDVLELLSKPLGKQA